MEIFFSPTGNADVMQYGVNLLGCFLLQSYVLFLLLIAHLVSF